MVNPTGDWTPYVPTDNDVQHSNVADFLACGSFSAVHIKEMLMRFWTGQESDSSERAMAKLSGTTHAGNSIQNVVNAINQYGFISVNDWPELVDTNPNTNWNTFYAAIPPDVLAKADKSWHATLTKLSPAQVPQALQTAPVWTIIKSSGGIDHIVAQINQTQYFDSYRYFIKNFQAGEPIQSQWQLTLTQKQMNQARVVKSKTSATVYLCYPVPSMDYLNETANLQGIIVPTTIPDTDSL